MAIQINLTDEVEHKLRQRAEALGVTLEGLAAELITNGVTGKSPNMSGSELVELWQSQGLIGYRADITDPAKHSTLLRRKAGKRDR